MGESEILLALTPTLTTLTQRQLPLLTTHQWLRSAVAGIFCGYPPPFCGYPRRPFFTNTAISLGFFNICGYRGYAGIPQRGGPIGERYFPSPIFPTYTRGFIFRYPRYPQLLLLFSIFLILFSIFANSARKSLRVSLRVSYFHTRKKQEDTRNSVHRYSFSPGSCRFHSMV